MPWDEAQEANRAAIERFDNFAPARARVQALARHAGEWAGVPLPVEGEELIVHSSYPFAPAFNKPAQKALGLRNWFYSTRHRCDIFIIEEAGKIGWKFAPAVNHLDHELQTIGASFAWGIEQEATALHALATLVSPVAFKHYLLTGSFLETSQRSGLTYLFRKLRPTVVITRAKHDPEAMRILCALCMHPIAYYAESWAGAMTPTDDVIAHLMLMRADEPMLWRRSNQHAPHRPEAGL